MQSEHFRKGKLNGHHRIFIKCHYQTDVTREGMLYTELILHEAYINLKAMGYSKFIDELCPTLVSG